MDENKSRILLNKLYSKSFLSFSKLFFIDIFMENIIPFPLLKCTDKIRFHVFSEI